MNFIQARQITNPQSTRIRELHSDTVNITESKLANYALGWEESAQITDFLSSTRLLPEDVVDALVGLVHSAAPAETAPVQPASSRFQQVRNFENFLNEKHWETFRNPSIEPSNKIHEMALHTVNLEMVQVAEKVLPQVVACIVGGQEGLTEEMTQASAGAEALQLVL